MCIYIYMYVNVYMYLIDNIEIKNFQVGSV